MKKLVILLVLACLPLACGGGKQVTRLDTESVTDLSGKWNDTDSRLVAEEMINDCLTRLKAEEERELVEITHSAVRA